MIAFLQPAQIEQLSVPGSCLIGNTGMTAVYYTILCLSMHASSKMPVSRNMNSDDECVVVLHAHPLRLTMKFQLKL